MTSPDAWERLDPITKDFAQAWADEFWRKVEEDNERVKALFSKLNSPERRIQRVIEQDPARAFYQELRLERKRRPCVVVNKTASVGISTLPPLARISAEYFQLCKQSGIVTSIESPPP